MAERPIFMPAPDSPELVREIFLPIKWHPGFALSQKAKNIEALHEAASRRGIAPLLEISSKSQSERGRHMSAFHITVPTKHHGRIKLELAFQGSKVFERGGPFTDLYGTDDREIGQAKRDPRLKESGRLIGFCFEGLEFPLEPKTAFYDWLYCSFLWDHRTWATKLYAYAGFTDVEFNPQRSINCQARSAALFLSLMQREELEAALASPSAFTRALLQSRYRPQLRTDDFASESLFSVQR
ncbi:MAG: hypothetical protein R2729_30765 [Bryobacteraceae bacterium]